MADTPGLEPGAARHGGSSPSLGTIRNAGRTPTRCESKHRSGFTLRQFCIVYLCKSVTDQPRYYCSYRDLLLLRRSMVMELMPSFAAFRFRTFVGRLRSTRSNSHAATFILEAVEPEPCPLSLTSALSWYVLRSAIGSLLGFI